MKKNLLFLIAFFALNYSITFAVLGTQDGKVANPTLSFNDGKIRISNTPSDEESPESIVSCGEIIQTCYELPGMIWKWCTEKMEHFKTE